MEVGPFAAPRLLQACDGDTITGTDAIELAQLVQGIMFLILSMFLIFVNNGKVTMLQRAPLEQRLSVSITLCVVVALFSGFFNLMQITSLNKIPLPRSSGYTMNIARPIEWLLTCPIMQLVLVIVGGPRIPSYRRWMMPGLTASMLISGLAGAFTPGALRYLWFGFGALIQCAVVYHNVAQISEHSDGEEGIFKGVSDFRRLSLKVIAMWYPFPIWYFLSPELLEVITDTVVINMGWVVLNIVSKFSFILYLQWIKTIYVRNLEATRELYNVSPEEGAAGAMKAAELQDGPMGMKGIMLEDQALPGVAGTVMADNEAKLASLVNDTMASMGLSKHGQRLFDLLKKNGITTPDILEKVTEERALDLSLPWNFVSQVQARWLAEKVALGDAPDAADHKREDPFTKLLLENKEKMALIQMTHAGLHGLRHTNGGMTPTGRGGMMMAQTPISSGFDIETILSLLMEKLAEDKTAVLQKLDAQMDVMQTKLEYANDAIGQRMDFGQVTILQSLNNMQAAIHRVDSSQEKTMLTVDAARAAVDRMEQSQSVLLDAHDGRLDSTKQVVTETVNEAAEAMLKKLSTSFHIADEKTEECTQLLKTVVASNEALHAKAERIEDNTSRLRIEGEHRLARKVEEIGQQLSTHTSAEIKAMMTGTRGDLESMSKRHEDVAEKMSIGIAAQEERMADVRRMNMMVMDTLVNMQERISVSADTIERSSRAAMLQDVDSYQPSVKDEVQAVLRHHMEAMQNQMEAMVGELRSLSQREGNQDLATIVEALSEQQNLQIKEVCKEMTETIRTELGTATQAITETNQAVANEIQEKVGGLKGSIETGFERFDAGLEKIISQAAPAEQARPEKEKEKESRKKERGAAAEQRG